MCLLLLRAVLLVLDVAQLSLRPMLTIIILRFTSFSVAGSVGYRRVTTAALSMSLLLGATGCIGRPAHVDVPDFDPHLAAAAALETLDQNGDGAIAGAELDRCPALKKSAASIDQNGDQKLTADEIEARVRRYLDGQLGIQSLTCGVQLNGRPLIGAEVLLEPESFLDKAIQPAQASASQCSVC